LSDLTELEIVAKVDDIVTKLATLTEPQIRTQFVPEITLAVEMIDMLNKYVYIPNYIEEIFSAKFNSLFCYFYL